jgi:predicted dehydrogenase
MDAIRLAFLGADEATAGLIRAALASQGFDLVGICELPSARGAAAGALAPLAGEIRPIHEWEQLLDDERVDAVVVARGADEDRRAEQLRKFVQTGMPVLASHPVLDSMLLYYELDMIRRETGSVIVPDLSGRNHPAVQALAELVRCGAESPIGKVEQLSVERCLPEPTKEHVERQFARDVDVVRAVAGDLTRLGAMAADREAPGYAGLGVQMSGPQGIAARWSVVPIHDAAGAKITLTGSRGRVALDVRPDGEAWRLDLTAEGQTHSQEFAAWDAADASLAQLAAAMTRQPPSPDWVDACRSVELAETIDRSLAKSRTIELYYEDYTEEGTFKGTMTSLGCGLLLAAVCVLALVGVAEQMNIPYVRYWPYVMVTILGVFLVTQLVMLTGRDRGPGTKGQGSGVRDQGSEVRGP